MLLCYNSIIVFGRNNTVKEKYKRIKMESLSISWNISRQSQKGRFCARTSDP